MEGAEENLRRRESGKPRFQPKIQFSSITDRASLLGMLSQWLLLSMDTHALPVSECIRNVLSKQSRAVDRRRSSSWVVGRELAKCCNGLHVTSRELTVLHGPTLVAILAIDRRYSSDFVMKTRRLFCESGRERVFEVLCRCTSCFRGIIGCGCRTVRGCMECGGGWGGVANFGRPRVAASGLVHVDACMPPTIAVMNRQH